MTFSICVREDFETEAGEQHSRFGVAVTTRNPIVGALCPYANEHGVIATQSIVSDRLARLTLEYLQDGVRIEDALRSLLTVDNGKAGRQIHGVDRTGTFAHTGEECLPWAGHITFDDCSVAGNLLVGESVLEATAETYRTNHRSAAHSLDDAPSNTLSHRLIDAIAAGHAAGGDKREHIEIQSAAVLISSTEDRSPAPFYNNLRVDATSSPIADLRETFKLAYDGYHRTMEVYGDAWEHEDMELVDR